MAETEFLQIDQIFHLSIQTMKLEDRLKNLDKIRAGDQRAAPHVESDDRTIESLEGTLARNRLGEFVLVRKSFDAQGLVRETKSTSSLSIGGQMLARICSPRRSGRQKNHPAAFNLRNAVFFDCETTGLAGGVGTYAFLIGVGYLTGEEFVIEQYFMQDFHQEGAVLTTVAERMAGFEFLVSYNGKCFDLPLLETRWTIHRMDFDHDRWSHIDLLYPCRRLWKKRIGDCSLGNIESRILGVRREVDVPSYMVPQIYFDYLRTGQIEPLVPVFHHNRYDILSLLSLTVTIDDLLEESNLSRIQDPVDLQSLGKIHRNLGNHQISVECFKQALSGRLSPELELEVSLNLAFLYKRIGLAEDAAQIWQKLVETDLLFSLRAHEELAKYHEHRKRDYDEALSIVDRAISCLSYDTLPTVGTAERSRLDSLEYRKSRLQRKIKKASSRAQRKEPCSR